MASLMGFLGNAAKRVVNTVNNDVVRPVQRDVVQPVQRVNQAATQGITNTVRQIPRAPILSPLLSADKSTLQGVSSVIHAPVNMVKFEAANLTHNNVARQNALTPLSQAQHTVGGFAQGIPRGLTQLEQSVRPGGIRQPVVPSNPVSRLLLGKQPVNSIQQDYSNARNSGTSKLNALTGTGISLATDVPLGLGAAKLAEGGVKSAAFADIKKPSGLNPTEVAHLSKYRQQMGGMMDDSTYQNGVRAAQKAKVNPADSHAITNLIVAHRNFDVQVANRQAQLTALNQKISVGNLGLSTKDVSGKPAVPNETTVLSKAKPATIQAAKQAFGQDVTGFNHTVDNYAVNHALKGQNITTKDISNIPSILSSPDHIFNGGKTKQGLDSLVYHKQIGGHNYYVEEVRTGKNQLAMKTLNKTKNPVQRSDAVYTAPELTPKRSGQSSASIVPPQGLKVNKPSVSIPVNKPNVPEVPTHEANLKKAGMTQDEYATLHDKIQAADRQQSAAKQNAFNVIDGAEKDATGKLTPKGQATARKAAGDWQKAMDNHLQLLNKQRQIDGIASIETGRSVTQPTQGAETPGIKVVSKVGPGTITREQNGKTYVKAMQDLNLQEKHAIEASNLENDVNALATHQKTFTPRMKTYKEISGLLEEKKAQLERLTNSSRASASQSPRLNPDRNPQAPALSSSRTSASDMLPVSRKLLSAPKQPQLKTQNLSNSALAENTPKPRTNQAELDSLYKSAPVERPTQDSSLREVGRITAEDRQKAQLLGMSAQRVRTLRLRPPVPPELNGPVNDRLAGMPSPTKEIPKSPVGVGQLPSMREVPEINRLLSNKVNVIRKIGGTDANNLADRIQSVDADKRAMRADWMSRIPTVQKLNHSETANFFDAVEKKAAPANPKVAQAVKEWNKITPEVHQAGVKEGLLIGTQKNYVPHSYDFKSIKGGKYDAAIQHLMDTNQVDHNVATELFKNMADEAGRSSNRFGNFENARLTDMPGYAKSKDALYQYLEGAAKRTAEARHFGTDNAVASKLLDNIRINGGDNETAGKALENYMRSADKGRGAGTLRTARGAFGVARLGKASISHLGQTSNTVVDTGVARTAASWVKALDKGNRDFVAKTGVINPQELHSYQDQLTSVKGIASKLTAPGLTQTMKANRTVTAIAYRDYAKSLAAKGNVTELQKLGVKGTIGKTLTDDQLIQAARGGVDRAMFSGSRATTPIGAETPIGKTIGQYRTAYSYKQTGFMYDRVIKEAGKGNLKPLARFLAVSAPIAAGTIAVKQKLSGTKEGPGGKALDTLAALGGIPGEAALQLARYGKKDLTKTVASTVAPLAGEAVDIGERTTQALQGKPQQLERYGLGLLPFVGNRVASAVVPYPPGSYASQIKQGTPQGTPQLPTGVSQLLNKSKQTVYVANINGKNESYKTPAAAQLALAKQSFTNSNQTIQTVGNNVLQRTATGGVTVTPQVQYNYQVNSATLTNMKDTGDVQGWLTTAQKQLQNIQNQLNDPSTTPLKALQLQNTASSIQSDAAKYTAYGGFTKPKSTKSSTAAITKGFKTAKVKAPKAPSFKVAKAKAYKSGSVKKFAIKAPKAIKTKLA